MMVALHPAWLLIMLAILAILGSFLVLVVVIVAVLVGRSPKREPIISEDGRWLWNGQQWVPNPPPKP